jgi:uncharacterized protein YciI
VASDTESLKRLGGGRWQTRDGRFTIEPASGTWTVVDAEQTDDLGLPLVRGPYRSLTEAKGSIEEAREGGASRSPLAEKVAAAREHPPKRDGSDGAAGRRKQPAKLEPDDETEPDEPPKPEVPEDLSVEPVWVVEAPYTRDAEKRRPRVRREHLVRIGRLLREGRLIEAGGYTDFSSAILIVRAKSAEDALALIRDDVYLRAGVWREPIRAREYGRVVPKKR